MVERSQRPEERAQVSAPPGYSEHHTGYALDLGDARHPELDLDAAFDQSAAFTWLQQHASRYHFRLSFPANNSPGRGLRTMALALGRQQPCAGIV